MPESTTAATQRPAASAQGDYRELKRLVGEAGLLERQPLYYAFKVSLTLAILAAGLLTLALVKAPVLLLLNAVFLAFAFTQIGFAGHDAGHRQVFGSTKNNDRLGFFLGNVLLGMSHTWWMDKHNQHHSHPNHVELDPDIVVPIIAFSEEQARSKRGFARQVVKYQAFLFFPLLAFEALMLRHDSIRFLMEKKPRTAALEYLLIACHFVWYFGMVFYFLPVGLAVLFVIIHQAAFGIYLGSVFAPNHKGMLIMDDGTQLDFLREQVLTARNVRPHPVTDFMYGGLNYQIEHHLFPRLGRNRLKQVQAITEDFCKARSIPYHETSALGSYREILQHFHQVGAELRGA
jgi:fatty acid desaturase